jgi:hypothetical protein
VFHEPDVQYLGLGNQDSDNTIPLPKITRRVLVEHRDRQTTERAEAGELWIEPEPVNLNEAPPSSNY